MPIPAPLRRAAALIPTIARAAGFTAALTIAAPPAAAQGGYAPVNLAPNSQWEIWSAVGPAPQMNPEGTRPVPPVPARSNSIGNVGRATFAVTATGPIGVGDLVTASGPGVDPCLTIGPMRVVAMEANRWITVRTYFGCAPSVSRPATLTMVGVGNQGAVGTGAGPDGWTKSVPMPLWRNEPRGAYAANMPRDVGAIAALGAKKDAAAPRHIYMTYSGAALAQFAGKRVVFGIYGNQVIRGGAGSWRIYVNDSVRGERAPCAPVPARPGYQWAECAFDVPVDVRHLYIGMILDGAAGDTYYFANPVLAIGDRIGGVHQYQKPRNEILMPTVHISPIGWINATIAFPTTTAPHCGGMQYCFEHDFYAETGGAVATSVRKVHGQLEGFNCGPVSVRSGVVRVMAYYDRIVAPAKSGSFLPQYVSCVKSFSYMDFPVNQANETPDLVGTGVYTTGVAGDLWQNVSEEFDWFLLN